MKAIKLTSLFLVIFSFLFFSCSKNEIDKETLNQNPDEVGIFKDKRPGLEAQQTNNHQSIIYDVEYCGTPIVVNLTDFEEEIYPMYGEFPGTVTVGNDEDYLYVTYERNNMWTLSDYKLYVGPESEIPGTPDPYGNWNYALNDFPYKLYGNQGTGWQVMISLSELDECFAVVAACNAYNSNGQFEGVVFGKQQLKYPGFHFSYCLQSCEEPPPPYSGCQTAYAYNSEYSICFIDGVNGVYFENWGWTTPFSEMMQGDAMEFDIYAGAGQCDITKGYHVGELTLSYYDGDVVVELSLFEGLVFQETHLYVGTEPFPKKPNGQYTVAPGQYPYKDNDATVWTDDYIKFELDGFDGDLYIISHSVVCGESSN